MTRFQDQVRGKNILVFGLGTQGGGEGDRDWLIKEGAIVRVSDKDPKLSDEGQNSEQISWADIIIKNPSVPDDHELMLLAKDQGKPVLTSIAVFVKNTSLTTIGVTGTRGKSTVTALIAELLEKVFPGQVLIGGNVPGTSGLKLFDLESGKKYAVLELSSFQLHNFHDLQVSPDIAVITNLYPDHLNRYSDLKEYQRDKESIVRYQEASDLKIANADNPGAMEISQVGAGKLITFSTSTLNLTSLHLQGEHNRENIAAAQAVAHALGISDTLCQEVLESFEGLPYRLEKIREIDGVSFVNDTTSTTPIAAIKAVEAQKTPAILICGGASKNLPVTDLIDTLVKSTVVEKIILLGSKDIPDVTEELKKRAPEKILGQVDSLNEAVDLAFNNAKPGWTILLSPGFASFDLFKNEFDRGEQFNEIVAKL